eukprot:1180666-Prorocentrum_minimum.AAC.1
MPRDCCARLVCVSAVRVSRHWGPFAAPFATTIHHTTSAVRIPLMRPRQAFIYTTTAHHSKEPSQRGKRNTVHLLASSSSRSGSDIGGHADPDLMGTCAAGRRGGREVGEVGDLADLAESEGVGCQCVAPARPGGGGYARREGD